MKKRIGKFFGEFKKFITRGNVLDMAVGGTDSSGGTAQLCTQPLWFRHRRDCGI